MVITPPKSFFLSGRLEPMKQDQLRKIKVAVGISGGVDSAVAATLLKKQGYEVTGIHLYCYDEGPYCTAPEDRKMAVRVAKHLGIPLLVWDLRKEYKRKVIRYFFNEYRAGRTPNPDVMCNREIKFGIFLERALKELKVDYIATGHYARIVDSLQLTAHSKSKDGVVGSAMSCKLRTKDVEHRYYLLRGLDETKDQSYFLYTLTQKQLGHILFPIGDYMKKEVRKMAKKWKIPSADRPDSQGICFIGPVPISKFLREKLPVRKGLVVNTKGEIVGEHDGVWFFTEGQRHGFKVFKSSGLPLYVVGKDVLSNTLVVGRGEDSKVCQFMVEKPHWIGELEDTMKMRVGVRIRHLGEIVPAKILGGEKSADELKVVLKDPVFGVAPGQSAVFYKKSEVLGGGIIQNTKPCHWRNALIDC